MMQEEHNPSNDALIKLLIEVIELMKAHQKIMATMEIDPFLSVADGAKLIGVSKVTFYKLIRKNLIPFYRIGEGAIKVKRSEVLSAYKLIKPKFQ
jgi:excisionase family DNA binding protein